MINLINYPDFYKQNRGIFKNKKGTIEAPAAINQNSKADIQTKKFCWDQLPDKFCIINLFATLQLILPE